jgi:hypothetical protein
MTDRTAEPEPRRDWSTLRGAEGLAELVRRYWRRQGYPDLDVWVEVRRGGREPLVVVKSRLGPGGMPPSAPPTCG